MHIRIFFRNKNKEKIKNVNVGKKDEDFTSSLNNHLKHCGTELGTKFTD